MDKASLLILLVLATGCIAKPAQEKKSSPIPSEIETKDFAKVELSNKYPDSLNAWLRENPHKKVVTFFLDRSAYIHTIDGDNLGQRFVQVDGGIEKVQSFLNERHCKLIAIQQSYNRSFILCICEE